MKRGRAIAIAIVAVALVVMLLDWTLGALDVFYVRRVADVRSACAAMEPVPGGALALRPGVTLHLGDGAFTLRTDGNGLRVAADGRSPGARSGVRIALLGDGAVLGWGVEDALTFARRLEPRLSDAARPAAVGNAGQLFVEPDDLLAILDARVLPRLPALVVVCGPVSDRLLPESWQAIATGREPVPPWWGRILPSIWEVWRRLAAGPPSPASAALDQDAWRTALAAVQQRCAAHGIQVVGADLGAEGFAVACAAAGVTCLQGGFVGVDTGTLTTDATRRFPNAAGHARIAERLATALAPHVPVRAR